MKILILTQYYPPETGAPQNRLSSLANNLMEQGCEVSVLTAMPNYPAMLIQENYRGRLFVREQWNGINIYRSSIFVSKSKSIVMRLLNYFSFVFSSIFTGIFRVPKHDIIICESPPLFLGISAVLLKWIKGSKLVFNVSDLWPESAEKLGLVKNRLILNLAEKLELWIYKKSDIITGQTKGIIKNITSRISHKTTFWLPNGIDFNYFKPQLESESWRTNQGIELSDTIVMYAGIIGYAQGIEVMIKAASQLQTYKVKFIIIGDGPEKDKLIALSKSLNLRNIIFLPNQPRQLMPEIVSSCDMFVVPLLKLDLFKGAIPSKLFEPLALRKPILLGVDGEAKELFIDEGKAGVYFEPENHDALKEAILKLLLDEKLRDDLGNNGYNYIALNFDRKQIATTFYNDVIRKLA